MNAGRKIGEWFKKINNDSGTGRKIALCFWVVLIICVIFWTALFAGQSNRLEKFNLSSATALEGELKSEGNSQNYVVVLPEAFEINRNVLFKSSHARVEVLLDGEIIYTFGDKPVVGKSPGTCWHVVSVPKGSAGKELVIRRISAYSSYKGTDNNFYYGSRGDCILRLVGNYIYVLVMNAISIVLGIICLLLHIRTVKKRDIQEKSGFLWIGLFSLIIAVWSLRQCGFLRFLIPRSEILYFIDIHTLFLAAVPLDMFVYSISRTKWGKSCLWFVPVYLIGVVFGTLMQIVGAFDIVEILTALHVFIAINAVYMFWAVHMEAWKNKGSAASRFRLPLYTMIVFGILEIIHYYTPSRTTSIFLPTGLMIFILLLVWQQVGVYFHMLEEQKLLYYEKFANTDMLTGALNRNAYEDMLKNLSAPGIELSGYSAALFDINDLKFINDNFGHKSGDEAIKRCYELIVNVFDGKGSCYRIGGDEFVFVVNEPDISEQMEQFEQLVKKTREEVDFPFNVALGFTVFDAEQDKDLQDTIKRSDANMYRDKQQKKLLQQSEGNI